MMTAHAMTIPIQDKARSYTERTLGYDFIPFAIKTYGCLHPCFDSFFTSYVHVCLIPSMFIFH